MYRVRPVFYRYLRSALIAVFISFAMTLIGYSPAYAAQTNLSWCRNLWPDLQNYSIYYKLVGDTAYTTTLVTDIMLQNDASRSDCIGTTAVEYIMDLPTGIYNFKLTLSSTSGFESGFSTERTKIVADPVKDTDNDGVSDNDELIAGTDPNNPVDNLPIIDCGIDKVGLFPGWQQTSCKTSDPNGDPLTHTWTVVSMPAGVTEAALQISSLNHNSLKLLALKAGEYIFNLDLSDGKIVVSKNVSLSVNDIPPKAIAGTKQVKIVGDLVTLNGSAEDPNVDDTTYEWSQTNGPEQVSLFLNTVADPSFTPIMPGVYEFALLVHDTLLRIPPDSTQTDSVIIVVHTVPIANAGRDRDAVVNTLIRLDGTKSHAADGVIGQPVGYLWKIETYPKSVSAEDAALLLSDSTSAEPDFIPPTVGLYRFSLVTSDEPYSSSPDFVDITVQEPPYIMPVANAGLDIQGLTGEKIMLGGGKSTAYNDAFLTYGWKQTKNGGILVELTGADSMTPAFTPAFSGSYIFELIVNDNKSDSLPDTIIVTVNSSNRVPVANAGTDITNGMIGQTIVLDGSLSSDADSDSLSYNWQQVNGADISLSSYSEQAPSFVPKFPGVYNFELRVKDAESTSSPDLVTILVSTDNIAAVAAAGVDRSVEIGVTVELDGSKSYDPDCVTDASGQYCGTLNYFWSKASGPGSVINEPNTAVATFTPDKEGVYRFSLDVSDGFSEGLPGFVNIYVFSRVYETMHVLAGMDTVINTDMEFTTVEAVIPAGALPIDSLVTIGASDIPSPFGESNGEVMVIGPVDGQLKQPVNVKLSLKDIIDNGEISLMVYDNSRQVWEPVDSGSIVERSDNYIVVQLDRLTTLAISQVVPAVNPDDTQKDGTKTAGAASGGCFIGFVQSHGTDGSNGGSTLFVMGGLAVVLLLLWRRLTTR